jgi:hypothetical protein
VVISDLNGAYGSTDYDPEVDQAIALMPFWNPDLVLCSGDMIAGQRTSLTRVQIQAMWAAFDRHVAAPLTIRRGYLLASPSVTTTAPVPAAPTAASPSSKNEIWRRPTGMIPATIPAWTLWIGNSFPSTTAFAKGTCSF